MTAWYRYSSILAAWTLTALPALGQEGSSEPPGKSSSAMESEPGREQCLDAHAQAQIRRKESALLQASELLKICSNRVCPKVIQTDCLEWTIEVEQQTPSIVIEARVGRQPASSAHVLVDNEPMPALDSGRAAPINPGQHVVRIEVPSYPPREVTITVYEGQRYQPIRVEFGEPLKSSPETGTPLATPVSATPHRTVQRTRPVPLLTWVLGGAGVLGIGGFTFFGLRGESKQRDLEQQCMPICAKDRVDSVRQNYRIADVSLGVGSAALVGAGIVFLTRPTQEHVVAFSVAPVLGGAALSLQLKGF